jgi:tetratricopeptide (TPR) repeat protein
LFYTGSDKESVGQISNRILLHHYPDLSKSRSNYLPLLELRMSENPEDYYGMVYLAHEYLVQKKYQKCVDYIQQVALANVRKCPDALFMPDLYLFLGDAYLSLNNVIFAEQSYRMGIASFPAFRDNYTALGVLLMSQNRVLEARDLMNEMFNKTRRFYSWLERDLS